jgi:hypothetical protein
MDRINRAMDDQKKVLDQLVLKKARPRWARIAAVLRGRGRALARGDRAQGRFRRLRVRRGDEAGLRELEAKANRRQRRRWRLSGAGRDR